MGRLSRQDIAQIRESIRVGSFCNKWWKQLSKQLKDSKISNVQKLQVFEKIIEGLVSEGLAVCETESDKPEFINLLIGYLNYILVGVNHE